MCKILSPLNMLLTHVKASPVNGWTVANCQFEEKHELIQKFNSAEQIADIKSAHKSYLVMMPW